MADARIDADGLRAAIRRELLGHLDAAGRRLVAGIRRRNDDDTGALDASFTHEVLEAQDRLVIGTELLHGRFRELGTRKMAPHAPIRRTLAEDADEVLRIAARGR